MRAFLAIELPATARDAVAALQARLARSEPDWRWTPPDALHVTLRFLGEVGPSVAEPVGGAWAAALASIEPFGLVATRLGAFPDPRRPRVLWVGVEEPDRRGRLAALAAGLEAGARALGLAAEERPFHGHVSIARAVRGRTPSRVPSPVERLGIEIPVREIVLFESRLTPSGARYTARVRFPLGRVSGKP